MTQDFDLFANFMRVFRQKAGNTAMIFALAIIPIISVAGFAIDFQLTTMRKNKVQAVIDSAVLAGAKEMQAGKTSSEIRTAVSDYVDAQLTTMGESFSCQTVSVTFADDSQDLTADITCTQQTTLMHIVGKDQVDFNVSSTSTWGIGKLDVAFMFDVSGSMSSNNRMVYLKDAALDAIDTLLPEDGGAATEDVRIAMVSYDDRVDAGEYFEEVTGLAAERTYIYEEDIIDESDYVYRGSCDTLRSSSQNCKRRRICERWDSDGDCADWDRERVCIPYEATQSEVDGNCHVEYSLSYTIREERTIESTCVWERPGTEAFTDAAPNASGSPLSEIYIEPNTKVYNATDNSSNTEGFMAAGYAEYELDGGDDPDEGSWDIEGTDCNPHTPLALTDSRTDLINYVNGLTTNGGTAGQQGIAWAWYAVSEEWNTIFTGDNAPLDYTEPDSAKAIILMTDGSFNREEFESDLGDSFSQAELVCDAIKNRGHVLIYTVAFQAPDDGQEILEYCASGPEFSFAPENGEELSDAYQAIATSISDLRVKY